MAADAGEAGGRPLDLGVSPGEFRLEVARDPHDPRDDRYPPPGTTDVADGVDTDHLTPITRARLRDLAVTPRPGARVARAGEAFVCPDYRALADPSWRQRGLECTGFALAAIVDYHLRTRIGRTRWEEATPEVRREVSVSRRMLYEMAQVYDQRDYDEGSTMRGALKGWSRHGVASEAMWPYEPGDEHGQKHGSLTVPRALDAVARPGGRYLRIHRTDSEAMRDALVRGFPLFASAQTHVGWFDLYLPGRERIERDPADPLLGGHAFVICGFDDIGWLVHNSWGPEWGDGGFGVLPYVDFDETGQDVWFVHSPRPTTFVQVDDAAGRSDPGGRVPSDDDEPEWLHRISIADDGGLTQSGRFGMNADEIATQLYLFRQRTQGWSRRRLVVFADGGYLDPERTLESLRPFRERLMAAEIYPLFLVWDSPWMDGLRGWLHGEIDPIPQDDRDRWAVLAKFAAAQFAAPRIWAQVQRAASDAARPGHGAAAILADRIAHNLTRAPFEIHLIGHGAGELVLAELAMQLAAPVASCNLWAPTTTMERFERTFGALLGERRLHRLAVHTLDADAERRDRTGPFPGSFVRLVAEVLEPEVDLDTAVSDRGGTLRWTPDPVPVLGLDESWGTVDALVALAADGRLHTPPVRAGTHVGLATDPAVWEATIAAIDASAPHVDDAWTAAPRPLSAPGAPVDPIAWAIARTHDDDTRR